MKNTLLPISIFVLYLLALNPYIGPGLYDDVIYLMGAESISKGEGYTFNGQIIGDWPPLFSIILSLPLYFGVPMVEAGKGVVLLFAFLGLFLADKLMKVEERKNRLAVLTLFALSPTSFVWSTINLSRIQGTTIKIYQILQHRSVGFSGNYYTIRAVIENGPYAGYFQYYQQVSVYAFDMYSYKNLIEGLFIAPSHLSIGIQLADMVVGAVFRKFEHGDDKWFNLLEPSWRKSAEGKKEGDGLVKFPKIEVM